MLPEIELKLLANQDVIDSFKQELSHFKLLGHWRVFSYNTYFDTHDYFFSSKKMGLRVRNEEEQYTMTLKTAGTVKGGLHIRPEYNVCLTEATPNLSLFANNPELSFLHDTQLLQSPLQAIFSTNFQREYYLLETGIGTQLEIAIDQGKIEAGQQQSLISEIEIELKSGQTEDMLSFIKNLLFLDGIRIGQESKAERGYQLAGVTAENRKVSIENWRDLIERHFDSPVHKLKALLDYELRLLNDLEKMAVNSKLEAFAVIELIGLFFNLYLYYCSEKALFDISSDKISTKREQWIEIEESQQIFYQRIRQIIAQHTQSQDHRKAIDQLLELTSRGKYLQRMINLLKITLK